MANIRGHLKEKYFYNKTTYTLKMFVLKMIKAKHKINIRLTPSCSSTAKVKQINGVQSGIVIKYFYEYFLYLSELL